MLSDRNRWSDVETMFNVKTLLQSVMDGASLMENLASVFERVVQYNRDNSTFEGGVNYVTIDFLCGMVDGRLGSPLLWLVSLYKG